VFGVAIFSRHSVSKPKGKRNPCVYGYCLSCKGFKKVLEELKETRIKAGDTTKDNEYTLETVNSLGHVSGSVVVKMKNIGADESH